jgi:hypothetical protein
MLPRPLSNRRKLFLDNLFKIFFIVSLVPQHRHNDVQPNGTQPNDIKHSGTQLKDANNNVLNCNRQQKQQLA